MMETSLDELGPVRAIYRARLSALAWFSGLFAILFACIVLSGYWRGWEAAELADTAATLFLSWFSVTVALALLFRLHVTRIHAHGLSGRNALGLPVRFLWRDIQGWRLEGHGKLASVILFARNSGRAMSIPTDVFFADEFQRELAEFPDIPIPEAF